MRSDDHSAYDDVKFMAGLFLFDHVLATSECVPDESLRCWFW